MTLPPAIAPVLRASGVISSGVMLLLAGALMGTPAVHHHEDEGARAWADGCTRRLTASRAALAERAPALGDALIELRASGDRAAVAFLLGSSHRARIIYDEHARGPEVLDWEQRQGVGPRRVHLVRRVGPFQLDVQVDTREAEALRFADSMQRVLDQCVVDAL